MSAKRSTTKPPPTPPARDTDVDLEPPTTVRRPDAIPGMTSSAQIRVMSMKTPHAADQPARPALERSSPKVTLRPATEPPKPVNLGFLAAPRDPAQARARRTHDNIIWGCVAVIIAALVALAIWFIAR